MVSLFDRLKQGIQHVLIQKMISWLHTAKTFFLADINYKNTITVPFYWPITSFLMQCKGALCDIQLIKLQEKQNLAMYRTSDITAPP